MNKIYVIGGGCSLKSQCLATFKDKTTIVVNKSLFYIPNANYFITLDYTFLRKINIDRFRNNPSTKVFVVNFGVPSLKEINGHIIDTKFNLLYDLKDFDVIIKSRKNNGIGLTFKDFRTGNNSGYAGFQLAVALGYTEIYLVGIDLAISGENTHFHSGYGENKERFQKKLNIYFNFWKEGILELKIKNPEIKVYITSKTSKLNEILPYKNIWKE